MYSSNAAIYVDSLWNAFANYKDSIFVLPRSIETHIKKLWHPSSLPSVSLFVLNLQRANAVCIILCSCKYAALDMPASSPASAGLPRALVVTNISVSENVGSPEKRRCRW